MPPKSPIGLAAVRASSTSDTAKAPKHQNTARSGPWSASRPPARLPMVMPSPATTSTHGTIDAFSRVTSVDSGAT